LSSVVTKGRKKNNTYLRFFCLPFAPTTDTPTNFTHINFLNISHFAGLMKIILTLPDSSTKNVEKGTTGMDIARLIGPKLARDALAILVNGEIYELDRPINDNAKISILTFDSKEGKQAFWHSTAHLLAQAVVSLWKDTLPTIGPAIEDGFYYDFARDEPFNPADLERIEKRMKEYAVQDNKVQRQVVSADEARVKFKHNKFKRELIDDAAGQTITIYTQGDYCDLCRGGHIPSTGLVKAFKLTKLSSAYWRGDAKNASLQRIYGISFPSQKMLDEHQEKQAEAEKRDHRKIGAALDLISFNDVSPGSPFFHPKGAHIINTLVAFMRSEYVKRGYQEVITPQLFHKELWETSGHWQHYRDNMFLTQMDGLETVVKPMNCPSHALIFKTKVRSYRELPMRLADFSALHRNEVRGTLGGLFRVRKLSQDDSHIFCSEEQIEQEVRGVIDFVSFLYKDVFHFEFHVELSTKPDGALGDEELWNRAEDSLKNALDCAGLQYKLNPGDGAFYGPKIDFHIKDALGRSWQCATIQLDFNQPKRFELEFDGTDGKRHTPVMIHRALLGSLERFFGILIEHYAGNFPLWLSPNQVIVLPIADRHLEYCQAVADTLRRTGLRVDVDENQDTANKKIREAQMQKWNYLLVVGDREVANNTVNVRTRDEKVHGEKKVEVLLDELRKEIEERR